MLLVAGFTAVLGVLAAVLAHFVLDLAIREQSRIRS